MCYSCRPSYNVRRPYKERSFWEGMMTIFITISLVKTFIFRNIEDKSLKEQSEKSMSNEGLSTERKSILRLNLSKPGMIRAEIQFNPLKTNAPHHTDSSQLICNANQLNDFYMMGNIGG